ncbi:MAG: hypothetical protein WC756_15555 [Taibaiella sp.]|jgi:hypothetical protein
MIKQLIYFGILFFVPIVTFGQQVDCHVAKSGKFIYHPQKSKQRFLIIRNDSIQKEVNLDTRDTSLWQVNWEQCVLKLKFLRNTKPMSNEELQFYKTHTATITILYTTKDYYVFQAGVTEQKRSKSTTDTMWVKR